MTGARLHDSVPHAKTVTKYSPGGFLLAKKQYSEGWPADGSTAAPNQQDQGQHGRAHTKPSLEHEFKTSYAVFEAG